MSYRYVHDLIGDLEYHTEWTWADVKAKYGDRSRNTLRTVLTNQMRYDLVETLNKNSGVRDTTKYVDRVVRFLEADEGATWADLERHFDRTELQLKNVLYADGQIELVRRVTKNGRSTANLRTS